MMRSLYSGVAGLKTHQTRMDVIGNNIANVNTVAYKSQSVTFSELLYQTTSSASGPNADTGTGGVNARQIGLGVKTGAISTAIATAGSAETTNKPFDICITGDSFFVVNNGSENFFTRDGSFSVDAAGNLVMSSTGYNVMGWQVDETTGNIKKDTVSALRIMSAANMTYPPEATTEAYVSGILDKNSSELKEGKIINLNFYDNRGYSYTAKMKITAADEGNYGVELDCVLDENGNDVTEKIGAKLGDQQPTTTALSWTNLDGYTVTKNTSDVTFVKGDITIKVDNTGITVTDANDATKTFTDDEKMAQVAAVFGKTAEEWKKSVASYTDATPADVTADLSDATKLYDLFTNSIGADGKVGIDITTQFIEGAVLNYSKTDGSFAGVNGDATATSVTLKFGAGADAASFPTTGITIDFSTSTNVNNDKVSTVGATTGNVKTGKNAGRKLGEMTGVSIQNNGMIYATYDNGQSKLLGQIAAASFANASGLAKEGDNLYKATQNSGEFDGIGVDITSDGGYMTTGELEMSNVDLSGELTGMIITQRGFQANSRIITVSDTMLEELVNLKR